MVERVHSKRRIMRDFRIDELSACDRPAQKHALAVLMKRADPEQEHDNMDDFEKIVSERPRSFASCEAALSQLKAMEAAARDPEFVRKYIDGGFVEPTPVRRVPTIPAEVVRFDSAVAGIMRRDGVDKLTALQQARVEFPRLFEEYQAAGKTPSDLGLRPPGAFAT